MSDEVEGEYDGNWVREEFLSEAHAELSALRSDLAAARAEVERNDQAYLATLERALAAERARDEALAKIGRSARRASEAQRIEAANRAVCNDALRERDEALAALRGLMESTENGMNCPPSNPCHDDCWGLVDDALDRARRVLAPRGQGEGEP